MWVNIHIEHAPKGWEGILIIDDGREFDGGRSWDGYYYIYNENIHNRTFVARDPKSWWKEV